MGRCCGGTRRPPAPPREPRSLSSRPTRPSGTTPLWSTGSRLGNSRGAGRRPRGCGCATHSSRARSRRRFSASPSPPTPATASARRSTSAASSSSTSISLIHLGRPASGEWICLDSTTIPDASGVGITDTALYDERGPLGARRADAARGGEVGVGVGWDLVLFFHLVAMAFFVGGQLLVAISVPVLRNSPDASRSRPPLRRRLARWHWWSSPPPAPRSPRTSTSGEARPCNSRSASSRC